MEQVTDEMRFCSRCGLAISGLAEWVANGGVLAAREEDAPATSMSPRRKGIRRGAKLMFLSGVLVPIFFGFSILADNPVPLMIPFTIFLTGLAMMLYARFFGEETASEKSLKAQPHRLAATPQGNALPPASSAWVNTTGGQRVRTAELAQPPPSVTEHTTRLLDRE
jgi:hypothetical protein